MPYRREWVMALPFLLPAPRAVGLMHNLMSCRLVLLIIILIGVFAPASRAQTDTFSFTANDGKFYSRIKVTRADDEGVYYIYTQSIGGGRLKFSQLPEDIAAQFKAMKPREKTFTDTLPTQAAKSSPTMFIISSSSLITGRIISDSAARIR
jgi:hypothetical protein